MYVLQNWTFTPGPEDVGNIVVPGVYSPEEFAKIQNVTRNIPFLDVDAHEARVTITDDGVSTTILLHQGTTFCEPTDELQIVMYNLYSGGGGGPSSNVAVTNWPASQNINGAVSILGEVEVKNDSGSPLPISGSVSVANFPAVQPVSGTVTANQGTSPWVIDGNVEVDNFPTSYEISNDVGNPVPVSGTITANQGTSPWIVEGTFTDSETAISSFPPTSTDAFGRLRVGNPYTIFDSSHRYADNELWASSTTSGGSVDYNAFQGLIDLNVTGALGSQVLRETIKVFPYQPGKSLQVMSTFVMNAPKIGLTQRVGYYGAGNGYFIELNNTLSSLCFVERSSVTGAVVETRVLQANWNVDPMDGSGPSGITLDITKAQILWMDLEWLGVGTVRMGFVIDGQFYICHEWQHANIVTSTYITTASLPLRYEIINTGATGSSSTLKQICSTVISEGGYSLTGTQQSVGTPILTPKALPVAGTLYPVVSVRLRSSRPDAIAIITGIALMGNGNNEVFQWKLINGNSTVAGGTWNNVGTNSAVEYNLTGTSITGGNTLASGYFNSSNQGSPTIELGREFLFNMQLERDPFTPMFYPMTLAVASANNNTTVYASLDWEEVTR